MARGDRVAVRGVRCQEPGHQGDDRQDPRARGVMPAPMSSDLAIAGSKPTALSSLPARISETLDLAIEAVSSTLLVTTIALALIQVFFRYVLNDSLSWPDEL